MKIIIIEGPDNCGKNTIISKLCELFSTVTIIHCDKPKYNDSALNEIYQDQLFYNITLDIINNRYTTDAIILNRAWYGEYVYGTIYRKRTKPSSAKMISNIEKSLSSISDNIYYIQLVTSPVLSNKNDDNKSLSQGKIDLITEEIKLFDEVYSKSTLHKKRICVNDGDTFRPINDIYNEIIDFINI